MFNLSRFDQLLVQYFRENRFPDLGYTEFGGLLLTECALYDEFTNERMFVFVPRFTEDMVEILFRKDDCDMIDHCCLEDELDEAYSKGLCVGYDLSELEEGRILIFFHPNYHSYEDRIDLISDLLLDVIEGEIKAPCYYGDFDSYDYEDYEDCE